MSNVQIDASLIRTVAKELFHKENFVWIDTFHTGLVYFYIQFKNEI